MNDLKGITLRAVFTRAQTTVDGGWRISLDVNHSEADAIMELSQLRDLELRVFFVPSPEGDDGTA